jgi:hypothetical protein
LGTLLELAFLPSSCGCSPPDLPDARSSVPTVEMMCIMTVSRHPSLLSHRPKTSSTVHEHGSNFDQAMKRTASQTFSISQESAREGERMGTLKEGTPAHYPASQHSHSSSFSRTVQNARPICRRLSSSSPRRPSVSLAETLVFERKPSTAIFHPRLHLQYQDSGIPTPAQSESSLPQPTAALSLSSSSPSPTLPGLHSKLSALSFKPSPLSGQPHQNQHDSV